MKAIVQEGYGEPERVLRQAEIEPPAVGDDDVLVRVRATSVNTPDWITVTGVPYVLRLQSGLRGPKTPVRGTFAELTVAPASRLIRKPAGLTFPEAAASVMSGITALVAVRDVARVGPGTSLLVNGASGGVGTFAVQVAKTLGAEVTGVCSAGNVELVRSLGADSVVDYAKEDFTRGARRYDAILDNVLNHPPRATARALAPDGVLMPNSVGNTGGWLAGLPRMARAKVMGMGSTNVRFVRCTVNRENLEALAALLEPGAVRVVVDSVYPLEEAPAAVARMLGHHASGKVVISLD